MNLFRSTTIKMFSNYCILFYNSFVVMVSFNKCSWKLLLKSFYFNEQVRYVCFTRTNKQSKRVRFLHLISISQVGSIIHVFWLHR